MRPKRSAKASDPRTSSPRWQNKASTVTSAQVSTTLKAAGYRRKRRGRKAAAGNGAAAAATNGLNLDALIAAKALIQKVGSVEAAEGAVRAMKKLG